MADALFEADGNRFRPSEPTRGPWSPDTQHAGPPAALLAFCVAVQSLLLEHRS